MAQYLSVLYSGPDGACRAAPTQHSRCCHGNLQEATEKGMTALDFSELNRRLPIWPENGKHTSLCLRLSGDAIPPPPPPLAQRDRPGQRGRILFVFNNENKKLPESGEDVGDVYQLPFSIFSEGSILSQSLSDSSVHCERAIL